MAPRAVPLPADREALRAVVEACRAGDRPCDPYEALCAIGDESTRFVVGWFALRLLLLDLLDEFWPYGGGDVGVDVVALADRVLQALEEGSVDDPFNGAGPALRQALRWSDDPRRYLAEHGALAAARNVTGPLAGLYARQPELTRRACRRAVSIVLVASYA